MSHYIPHLAVLKKALREENRILSRTFIPEMVTTDSKGKPINLSTYYNARITVCDKSGNPLYTLHDIPLEKYWVNGEKLVLPPNHNNLSIYSRCGLKYPYVIAYVKLPDFAGMGYDDYTGLFIGVELGSGERWGIAAWRYRVGGGANRLYAHVGGCGSYDYAAEQTSNLPSDYLTTKHAYWVKVNRHQIWFGIDERIRVFVILAKSGVRRKLYDNSKPYTIFITPYHVPETMNTLLEINGTKDGKLVGLEVELDFTDYRWAEGDPQPPLALPLYVESSDTLLAGYSFDSGSAASHPVPIYGYENKTIYFMADKDGTVSIQVYTLSGNWREYDSINYTAGKLLTYTMTGNALLARVVFTPSSYPAKIEEAEVVML